jgi:alpha-galactosidase
MATRQVHSAKRNHSKEMQVSETTKFEKENTDKKIIMWKQCCEKIKIGKISKIWSSLEFTL